jgi:hypothetical protein
MPADVLPIGTPSRAELWRRLQLARAVLNHRPPGPTTGTLVLCALDGVPLETLVRQLVQTGVVHGV